MASNPYFRYESTSLDLAAGVYNPSFPVQAGLSLHSYATEKPKYTITNRLYGTTAINWRSENVKQDDRGTIYDFWNDTLSGGYYDFTVIDNRSRLLFEASWNDWRENWKKLRGGLHDIDYNIEASVPWTPPIWGAYLIQDSTLNNFTLQGSNFSGLGSGATIPTNSTDSNVLRLNGGALKVTPNAGATQIGASANVEFKKSDKNGSFSMFCQAMNFKDLSVGRVYPISMLSGSNSFRIGIEAPDIIKGFLNSTVLTVNKTMDIGVWYDLCFTYDGTTRVLYLYAMESGTGSTFTDFLSDTSTLLDELASTSVTVGIDEWDTINLIQETFPTAIPSDGAVYVQNAMFIDGFVTPFDFNFLRRLCHLWNGKTTIEPK
jgi:hypothetical protein